MKRIGSALVLGVLVLTAFAATAQAPTKGFRAEFLMQQDGVEKELLGLAEATPPGKFGWRPAEGVRSVSEVFVHVAGGNYLFLGFAGVKVPDGSSPSEKAVTDKAAVIEAMKKSFAALRAGVASISDADLDKPVTVFGHDTTVRGVLLIAATHEHEHLGQSIAYARMNGIVPPWTAARQARAEKPAEMPAK
jgi:uncharacterized damage-inducible protein DinB